MKAEDFNPYICQQDPHKCLDFIDKFVTINTKIKSEITGFIKAIDPVSGSIVICTEMSGRPETLVLMGHTIDNINISTPPEGCSTFPLLKASEEKLEDILERKQAINSWLSKNLLPVTEVQDVLQVHNGQLSILPPYGPDDCVSNNSIILGRIQHLLNNMPKVDNS